MTNFTDPANLDQLIGLWDFREGNETADTGLDDGIAQDGETVNYPPDGSNAQSAAFGGGYLHVGAGSNSKPTVFDVNADGSSASDDAQFNLDRGTLETQFIQTQHSGSSEDVILSRGEKEIDEDDEGFFEIRVTKYGEVEAYHNTNNGDAVVELSTSKEFFCPGDVVNVKYSFDVATGATLTVTNVTAGTTETITVEEPGLTFDLTDDDDEEFTFGAREKDDGEYDKEFQGKIDYVALYTTDDGASGPSGPDGIVDGEDFGEVMTPGYDDANAPTDGGGDMIDGSDGIDDVILGNGGDDEIDAGLGDDTVFGGADDDTIDGGQGDDLIYGDDAGGAAPATVRESFEWDKAPDPNGPAPIEDGDPISGFTQNTGNVDVTFSILTNDHSVSAEFASNAQNVSDIQDDGAGVDTYSSLDSDANNKGDREVYELAFSQEVENVSFRVNDIDGDGVVKFTAWLDGQPVEFQLDGGSKLTLIDTDGVAGADTADSQGGYQADTSDDYSVLVTIPGPVDRIVIDHSQNGYNDSGVNVTDVYFDVQDGTDGPDGNDSLIGGEGDDTIFGEGGDDTIVAGAGDAVTGGAGDDMIVVDADEIDGGGSKTGAIDVDGSTEGTDYDTLDLTDFVSYRNLVETVDPDGDSTSGTVEVENGDGDWVNVTFAEIETLVLPPEFNEDPEAEDDIIAVDEDDSVTFDPLANDSDPNAGDTLTVTDISDPSNGTLTDNGDGTYTYTPDPDYNGPDSVIYTVSDGNGGTDTATVTFNVAPVNDDPVAADDSDSTAFETEVQIDLLANDSDVDGDSLTVTSATVPASQGSLTEVSNGVYTFKPDDGFEGTATVSYTISDGMGGTDSGVHTIEVGADPTPPDGVVDGEEFAEVMNPLYDDANAPTDGGGDIIDGPDGDNDSIRGNGGDDTINAGEGDDTVDGGADDDSIRGGNGDDIIMGGAGDDTVRGEDGDDTVSGGAGNDSVTGGKGDDDLSGGAGDDSLTGSSGDDTIDGGTGDDSITGSTGADSITDMSGDNLINSDNPGSFNPDLGTPLGTPGLGFAVVAPDPDPNDNKDTITTGDGDDTINAGDDADLIDAGDGDNVVDGGTDRDTITTGAGDDSITGGEGDDLINAGAGDDTIDGGIGNPAANFIDEPNEGFAPDPILDNGDDTINAGAGDDVVNGEDDNDLIDGGTGDDTLDGGIDDDTILGGDGDDVIIGGQGADSLDGGFGDDVFKVGTFTDPNGSGDYVEGAGDTIVGGEDPDDGDLDTLDLTGAGSLKVLYEDSVDPTGTPGESGTVIFYTDNTQTEEAGRLQFKEIENVIPCFTPGTMIATPRGEVPVESLREGDRVITRDNGIQEIRWTGNRTLNRAELAEGQNLKPILIKAGSLGRNLPERDMLVSPQHRVLVTGETPQLYFEESEVLVAAKHLVGKQGVSVMDTMRTTYIHFMFDRHEVVLSDGAWTESFQPGDQSLGAMGQATRDEIIALFPELATEGGLTDYAAARRSLKAHEAKLLRL